MKTIFFICALCICLFSAINAKEQTTQDCVEKEKAIALLETAESFLNKAGLVYPSCNKGINTTGESKCSRQKSLAYFEVSKDMLSKVIKSFPDESKPIEKDKKDEKDEKIIEEEKFRHCAEIFSSGNRKSGVHTILVGEDLSTAKPLQVYCDMETDGGGWTVIQRRGRYPVQQDFTLGWESYKNGFGNINQEFWLGNENIRVLCAKGCEIRFDLQDERGEKGYAKYNDFRLSSDNYRMKIGGYTGNIGDCMQYHNNNIFATIDKNDPQKAYRFKGGWWQYQYYAYLNGVYIPGSKSEIDNVHWYTWRAYDNLAKAEMKIRAK